MLIVEGELNFDTWAKLLRNDCVTHNKVGQFDGLGEYILRLLFENGLDPTVEAIVKDGINGKTRQKESVNHPINPT